MFNTRHTVFSGYGCEDVDPRGFVSLMDMYENNYLRLRKLIPELDKLPDYAVSRLPGCLSLHATVLERTDFTTTLLLTYFFEEGEQRIAEPALTLRVYHDASQVEVLTGHLKHGRQHVARIPSKTKEIKWQFNRFLYKWLGYCLYLGHSFSNQQHQQSSTAASLRSHAATDLSLISDREI
jgi:uncharacterized protein YqiB (DUF1249 family)